MAHTWNAEDYASHSAAQFDWAVELIAKLSLRGDEAVLDLGCGDGKIDARLAALLPHGRVVGLDSSSAMIDLATARYPAAQHPNLAFVRMDVRTIRLPARFEIAFSNAALHWADDHEAILRGVRSCLVPGGRILFQMGGRGNAADVFAAVEAVVRRPGWRGYFDNLALPWSFYGPEDYGTWLPRQGFHAERVELFPRDMHFAEADAFRGWLRTTWFHFTDRLPTHRRDPFLNDVIDAYTAAHPPGADGTIRVRMVRLEVEARASAARDQDEP